ncbi:MAG: CheY-like chemotaxis protein [Bradymonadia bacterium]|jgi:CheY-like chemotaxis protein
MSVEVLFAGPETLRTVVGTRLAGCTVTTLAGGADLVGAYVRCLHSGKPPTMIISELALDQVDGRAAIRGIRAVERGLRASPVPILAYAACRADDELTGFIQKMGHVVHLHRPQDATPADQINRLERALERLLEQLGKR